MTLTIEITSDFICPWCLVAQKRLKVAIAQLNPSVNIERFWYPFELNPDMPEMGMELSRGIRSVPSIRIGNAILSGAHERFYLKQDGTIATNTLCHNLLG